MNSVLAWMNAHLPGPVIIFVVVFAFGVLVCAGGWVAVQLFTALAAATGDIFATCFAACLIVASGAAFIAMEPRA